MLSPIVAPVAQSGTLRIEHKEPNFRCHMTIVLDGKPFETKYEMLSDGRETVATEGGRRTASSLRWDADALVATWRVAIPNGELTISFRYELENGARRLEPPNSFAGVAATRDNVWVFDSSEPITSTTGLAWSQRSRTLHQSRPPRDCRFCPVHKRLIFSCPPTRIDPS
jgi:hypothetical protein